MVNSLEIQAIGELVLITNTSCNSRCRGCNYWFEEAEEADFESIKRDLLHLSDRALNSIMLTGGEPLLYPPIRELIEFASTKTNQLKLATNGMKLNMLSEALLGRLSCVTISLDAVSAETYNRTRGVDCFEQVVSSVKLLLMRGIDLRLSFLLQQCNAHEFASFFRYAADTGVGAVSLLLPDYRCLFGGSFESLEHGRDFIPEPRMIFEIAAQIEEIQAILRTGSMSCNFHSGELPILPQYLAVD